jgi:hypothetical protein
MGGAARVAPPCPSRLTRSPSGAEARSAAKRSDESRRSEAQVVLVIQRKWSNGGSNTRPVLARNSFSTRLGGESTKWALGQRTLTSAPILR